MADAPPAPPARGPHDGKDHEARGADPALADRARLAARRANRFGVIALAALVAGSLPLPWALAGLAFGALAMVVGIMAFVAALDARLRAGAITLLSVSLVVVAVLMLVQVVRVVVYPVSMDYQECTRQALTDAAAAACDTAVSDGSLLRLER